MNHIVSMQITCAFPLHDKRVLQKRSIHIMEKSLVYPHRRKDDVRKGISASHNHPIGTFFSNLYFSMMCSCWESEKTANILSFCPYPYYNVIPDLPDACPYSMLSLVHAPPRVSQSAPVSSLLLFPLSRALILARLKHFHSFL